MLAERHSMDIRSDPRLAGNVSRWHTWPTSRPQSVAEHSWNVARILLAIWPEARKELVVQCLLHDVGEIMTGDVPYPIKSENADLQVIMNSLEKTAHLSMCLPWQLPPPADLTALEAAALKMADMLEMWEFACEEIMRGCNFAIAIEVRCRKWLQTQFLRNPDTMQDEKEQWQTLVQLTRNYISKRDREWCT